MALGRRSSLMKSECAPSFELVKVICGVIEARISPPPPPPPSPLYSESTEIHLKLEALKKKP
ncbi:hypothetical protein LINPERPRIM_LOCUS22369 [Linum perenne]